MTINDNFNFEKVISSTNDPIIQDLRDHWQSENNYTPEHNEFRISQIYGCNRKAYHEKVDIGKKHIRNKSVFASGNAYHEFIQNKLYSIAFSELEVKGKYKNIKLRGHIDVIYLTSKRTFFICDIKTTSNKSFLKNYQKEASIFAQHQTNAYYHLFKNSPIFKEKIKEGYILSNLFGILVVNRDNFDMLMHVYKANKLIYINDLEELYLLFNRCIDPKIPPLPHPKQFYECYGCWCQEKDLCKGSKQFQAYKRKNKQ